MRPANSMLIESYLPIGAELVMTNSFNKTFRLLVFTFIGCDELPIQVSAAYCCYAACFRPNAFPMIAPNPTNPVLITGMTGPRKLLTAIAAATINPITPPKSAAP
jgi:hypothetical protein